MARFRQPGVAFGCARIASIKADYRREQERIRQAVRQMKLSAELMSNGMV